ncbi:hypothetical protein BJ322DRAFT_1183241 [Thelephora terrestris]|uniref:SET domain-containing protein n=1 Tax=Thelephora terrestris TaxID=56493 RepID=A0A9P6HKD7_9AGAM|nr:hypothetical protein BJ322DRAFT_1183241 [Thelephora terrestris]
MAEENILDTYQSSWNDFYAWELEYASEAITSLATDFPARDLPDAEDSYFSQDIDILSFRPLKRPISGVPLSPPKDLPSVQAHPRYQACTPSNRNIMAKRPQHNPFVLTLFIPFADEPRFQSKYFLEEFLQDSDYEDPKLFWQSLADPDHENIQLQAFLKLRQLGYTMSQIDAEMVLPTTDADGLLLGCKQRDLLEWPGMLKKTKDDILVIEKWDVVSRVDSMLRQFCPFLSCIQPACPSHAHDRELNRNVKPTLNNSSLRQRIKSACDNMCFAFEGDEYIDAAPRALMTKDVISLIELLPDELPCHLAGLSRLSCRDAFAYRSRTFPSVLASGPIHPDSPSRDPNPPPNSWFMERSVIMKVRAINPREENATVTCVECIAHVTARALKAVSFGGKAVRVSGAGPRTRIRASPHRIKSDPSANAGQLPGNATRRCVVNVMPGAEAISGIRGYGCTNVPLQKGNIKTLEVAEAKYGLGAFATQSIKKDEYIGEYVGELYGTREHTSRPYLNLYTGLNYLFDLNRTLALDALTVGNETRYLNHSGENNVIAVAQLVNDEHRILYRATKSIAKNKELFLDYGENYWAEGSFEDYLARREERKNSGEGTDRDAQQDDPDFTHGSETVIESEEA